MKARQALIDQWQLMEKHGIKPSARKVIALVRLMGIQVRNDEAFACLRAFRGALWERSKGDTGSSKGSRKQAQREQSKVLPEKESGSVSSAPSREKYELLVTTSSDTSYLQTIGTDENSSDAESKTAQKPTQRKPVDLSVPPVWPKASDPSQPDWVREVRHGTFALSALTLDELDVDQRFLLARFHAWRWCNCTKDQGRNRKSASSIAAGIANLAFNAKFGTMTVATYVASGDEAWNRRGRYPMKSVWDLVGTVELEEVV